MTPRCTVPSPTPCRREPETWIGVDGVAYLACELHRTAATRSGAWVEVDWTAPMVIKAPGAEPVPAPAPRFAGRPKSVEVIPDEPGPVPKRIGRPPGPRPTVALAMRPTAPPKPKAMPHAITRVEVDDATPLGMCRNEWCPGRKWRTYRPAHVRGLCKSCRDAAKRLGCLESVALPLAYQRNRGIEIDPTTAPHLCRNTRCPGGAGRRAHARGLCDACIRTAQRLGVFDTVALPPTPGVPRAAPELRGGRHSPAAPCRRCGAECKSTRRCCKKCYDRAARRAEHLGLRMSQIDADTLYALTAYTRAPKEPLTPPTP